jgi:hypothetical protein
VALKFFILFSFMNREQVIAKIQAILKLQNGTDFEGEASAAANLIDKLCNQYNVSLDEATKKQVLDESLEKFKRINSARAMILNAVATFYDAKAYVKNGDEKSLQILGTEAQQIQTKLYYEYLLEVMERECDKAHKAEKVIAELSGKTVSRSFKINFRKAFADKVSQRLQEMKREENRVHEDADVVSEKLSTMRFGSTRKFNGARGEGAIVGGDVGANVSLRRQATGASAKALCGV